VLLSRARATGLRAKFLSRSRVTELRTEPPPRPRATELRAESSPRPRVTELLAEFVSPFFGYKRMLVHEFASPHKFAEVVKVAWNVRQRIKPDSILPSDPKTSSGALQELSKASAF